MAASKGSCIVVGASSGIGLAVARRLALAGRKVAMLARREAELKHQAAAINESVGRELAFARVHDAADVDTVEALFADIEKELGPVDELHFTAGVMPAVGRDEFDLPKDRLQVEVNMLGCIAWGNAAARRFQQRRGGCIVGVTSVAQDRGRVGRPVYNASKAGMDTYLEALRNRLSGVGVHVCTIKPGYVDTAMTQGLEGLFWLISADEAARQILGAARNRVNVRYVPARWQAVGTTLKLIPSAVFRHLNF